MSNENDMGIAFQAIIKHLENAIEECTAMEDLPVFQGFKEKLEVLSGKVMEEAIKLNVYMKED